MTARSTSENRFASALSTSGRVQDAISESVDAIRQVDESPPDLTVVFASHHLAEDWDELAGTVCDRLGSDSLIGSSGESIVGGGREIEGQAAFSIWSMWAPGGVRRPFHLSYQSTPDGGAVVGWPDELAGPWSPGSMLLLLAEPFTFPADFLLQRMNEDRPQVAVLGGVSSGAAVPGENRLFLGRRALFEGAVGVVLDDSIESASVVSQGCRPIGEPMVITRAERNAILELGGRPAMDRLRETFAKLPTHEQQLVQRGLHVGRVVTEYRDHFEAGDFLVRNVVGIDPDVGAIAITDYVRAGQTVQFHIRDERTAHDEMEFVLSRRKQLFEAKAALLFTCNGRGTRLFSESHHDARLIASHFGQIPLAGFFAQGEMGPVAGSNFLHGFTASIALFR